MIGFYIGFLVQWLQTMGMELYKASGKYKEIRP